MSERGKRKYEAAVLDADLKEAEREMERWARRVQALRAAITVLNEEPKKRTSARMRRHYLPVSKGVVVEQSCSECGAVVDGHVTVDGQTREIRACPWCGSDVENVEREKTLDDANARLTKQHVQEAMDLVYNNKK